MKASASTEQLWAERVRGWREAGVSAEAYARGKGFSGSALRMWNRRLSPRTGLVGPRIVPLVLRGSAATGEVIVEVGSVRVRVTPGFDRALLTEVISVLGAAR